MKKEVKQVAAIKQENTTESNPYLSRSAHDLEGKTFEILNVTTTRIKVRELNYQDHVELVFVPNKGTNSVSLYDIKGRIWDFEGDFRDYQKGDQLKLRKLI